MEKFYFDKTLYYYNVIHKHHDDYLDCAVCEILHDKLVTPFEDSRVGEVIYSYYLKDVTYTVCLSDCVID